MDIRGHDFSGSKGDSYRSSHVQLWILYQTDLGKLIPIKPHHNQLFSINGCQSVDD